MGKHHLRKDKTCENCGHIVEERFCSRCGQENVETRQTFGHLVRHFMEDLTHYESNFWKTIKYLLFRPALLTQHYLSGKRMTYVAPVRLYLFISFIAFFLPAIIPNVNEAHEEEKDTYADTIKEVQTPDSLNEIHQDTLSLFGDNAKITGENWDRIETEAYYDSVQNSLPKQKRDDAFTRFVAKKSIQFRTKLSKEEAREKFIESIKHNFPKALFIYLPLFAFIVWLFHGKKRWYYFDHAIFTLHNFSFLLLMVTIFTLISHLIPWHYIVNPKLITILTAVIGWFWSVYYFYRGHRKLYGERWVTSAFKASLILFVNSIVFLFLFIAFVILLVFSIH
jgi:hypothetical protein